LNCTQLIFCVSFLGWGGAKTLDFEKKLFTTTCAGTEMRGRGAADE
jgi:hypothetical protein